MGVVLDWLKCVLGSSQDCLKEGNLVMKDMS